MPNLSSFITVIGGLVTAIFTVMMTFPEWTVARNLKTFWAAWGLAPRTGLFVGLAIVAAGVVLVVVGWRNRRSSGHAIVEAKRIVGSVIEDNYSERSDSAVSTNDLRSSVVRRNILKK